MEFRIKFRNIFACICVLYSDCNASCINNLRQCGLCPLTDPFLLVINLWIPILSHILDHRIHNSGQLVGRGNNAFLMAELSAQNTEL